METASAIDPRPFHDTLKTDFVGDPLPLCIGDADFREDNF
jgi:hypothetical protein